MAVTKGAFSSQSRTNLPVSHQRLNTCALQANAFFGAWRHLLHPISRHVSHHLSPTKAIGSTASALFPGAGATPGISAENHKPLHFARFPQRQLRTLIGMVCHLRVAHTQEVCLMRLPLHRVTRQGMISVLQRQYVLEDSDEGLFAGQSLLTREQEMTASPTFYFRSWTSEPDQSQLNLETASVNTITGSLPN
jgi:hypothetical protein